MQSLTMSLGEWRSNRFHYESKHLCRGDKGNKDTKIPYGKTAVLLEAEKDGKWGFMHACLSKVAQSPEFASKPIPQRQSQSSQHPAKSLLV